MSETIAVADSREAGKAPSMGKFERFLTLWVALCIIVGIGASNFFELAVATAIALFGFQSGAALA